MFVHIRHELTGLLSSCLLAKCERQPLWMHLWVHIRCFMHALLLVKSLFVNSSQVFGLVQLWRQEGGMRPGQHCAAGGIWRGENMKLWNVAASGELAFALQWYFTSPSTPLILPQFLDYTPTVSAPRPHTKQCIHLSLIHISEPTRPY